MNKIHMKDFGPKYKLNFKDINLYAYHGLYPKEKKNGQNFEINLDIEYKPSFPNKTLNSSHDQINDFINYIDFYNFFKKKFNQKRFNTLEGLLDKLIFDIESEYPTILYIKISIMKPDLVYENNKNFIKVEREFSK